MLAAGFSIVAFFKLAFVPLIYATNRKEPRTDSCGTSEDIS